MCSRLSWPNMYPRGTDTVLRLRFSVSKADARPTYDYTVDYRRYSYSDFETSGLFGKSNVDPALLAAWLSKAQPRNQDDVYPLFVLCKDLLEKFCKREIRCSCKVWFVTSFRLAFQAA